MAVKKDVTPKNKYTLYLNLRVQVGYEVTADSFEDAVEISKNLGVADLISFGKNDHTDSECPELSAIYKVNS